MKTDIQIQKDLIEELNWEPFVNVSEIGVAVKNGIVTLSGCVDTYAEKIMAEKVAKRVSGVKAVAEDIIVNNSPKNQKTDTEIAAAVIEALKWHAGVQDQKIKIKVENGIVKLEGVADWEYQRKNAETAIQNLVGVHAVINMITVIPQVTAIDIQQKIKTALIRNASIDAARILVDVIGNKVILRGKVKSFAEIEDAERTAWSAPGISDVESKLEIVPPEYSFVD